LFSTRPFFAYQESVHGRAAQHGNSGAAVCSDCHSAHDVARPNDPLSPIFRSRIPATCGTCHAAVLAEYQESIHGRAAAAGITDSPVCTDCHGIHSIRAPEDPQSSVSARAVSRSTCARCHASERLSAEFGVPRQRVESYYDSFHGLESSLGSVSTANCASCHGVHRILPSSDSRSTIHPTNLPGTCGRCHPGASENFARGQIHLVMAVPGGPGGPPETAGDPFGTQVVRWVRSLYLWLIALVIGGMVLHNLLDYVARARRAIAGLGPTVERLTRAERLQHGLLMLSFLTLVITGFALKFPTAGWVQLLFSGWPGLRSVVHRVAAILLVALGGWHLLWLFAANRGREQLRALRPLLADARELLAAVRRNLGLGGPPPMTGRFGYVEKAEYWALIWGTLIMTVTGVILWAQNTALLWMPKWGLDVAEVVHYYEAWLATLSIGVWHLYFTILRPGNRSRRWSWITGRLGVEEWREEHSAEYAERGTGQRAPRPGKEGEGG
jgi:cytochrome b subunit of formate dehydrogenase